MKTRLRFPLIAVAVFFTAAVAMLSAAELKPSHTVFSASATHVADGDSVTLNARVVAMRPEDGTPSGTVEFFDGATSLGTADLVATGEGPLAQLAVTLALGPHPITVQYAGDSSFGGSVSPPEFVLVVSR